ncbi:hypothetical protein [Streptomyces sp. NPDC054962]
MTATVWIALAGVIAALSQLWMLNRHTSEAAHQAAVTNDAIRASVHIEMAQMMIGIDRLFLENPALRAKFYGPSDGAQPDGGQQADAAAEMLVDFIEALLGQQKYMPEELSYSWKNYFGHLMESGELREFWNKNRLWYGLSVREFLDPLSNR